MFEVLEHPADIGFRTHARTMPELFENAAVAMLSIAAELGDVSPRQQYSLQAAGTDRESLLVNWLNEVLYWFDGKRIALSQFQVTLEGDTGLTARAFGEPRDPERHRGKLVVKGVTWHQLKIAPGENGWIAEVYLDI